jgi:hypothetical protein
MKTTWTIVALLWLAQGCRSAAREVPDAAQPVPQPSTTPPGTGASGAPVLSALAPDSVRLDARTISEVVLRGSGFAPAGTNTVRIGPIVLTSVPANADGTEIRVVVPARYATNNEAPPRPLFPGSYPVTVETRGLTSASVMLKVIQ